MGSRISASWSKGRPDQGPQVLQFGLQAVGIATHAQREALLSAGGGLVQYPKTRHDRVLATRLRNRRSCGSASRSSSYSDAKAVKARSGEAPGSDAHSRT